MQDSREMAIEPNKEVTPRKLTEETIAAMEEALKDGATHAIAALSAGVSEASFYRWMKLGAARKSGIFREFHDRMKAAEATGDLENLQIIRKASKEDWKAARWLLQARHPEVYGNRTIINHGGEKPGEPIRIAPVLGDLSQVPLEKLASLDSALEEIEQAGAMLADTGQGDTEGGDDDD